MTSNNESSRSHPEASTPDSFIISGQDQILVTGATGFIGLRLVEDLIDRGFYNLVCFARPSSDVSGVEQLASRLPPGEKVRILRGNLLSRADCDAACENVSLIFHLAADKGTKSYPQAFMNSVVTTRNLLDASLKCGRLQRFVLVSSFSVYTNRQKARILDETCPIEEHPEARGEAYCYAKVKQEQLVHEYSTNFGIPYVVVRPGSVYGPGEDGITGRIGLSTFGPFVHVGGSNAIPFTYVDNCAEAIVLAGLIQGVNGEVFNVVDDDLPSSRRFLSLYKRRVRRLRSVYVPHAISYASCYLWEKYSQWSQGQLPPVFNRAYWYAYWKKTRYSNQKLKARLGWMPKVSTNQGLERYFSSCRN